MTSDLFDKDFERLKKRLKSAQSNPDNSLKARALVRKTNRIETRRAKTEAVLLDILPGSLEMGTSYHVLSHGDVDALSFLIHVTRHTAIENLLVSSWCMAQPDIDWIISQLHCGRIGHVQFVLGEIFPSQYPDEHSSLLLLAATGACTFKIARNHAKVMAGQSPDGRLSFAIESSANINTNPRIEQTAIHMSEDLYRHYVDFFSAINSIDRSAKPRIRK